MARLADICPSSDDELPDLKTLIRRPTTRATRTTSKPTTTSVKPLDKKPAAKTESRRIRRLGEPSKPTTNPLFQRWNSEEHESSRDSLETKPTAPKSKGGRSRRGTPTEVVSSQSDSGSGSESGDELPCPRRQRQRRQKAVENSEDNGDGGDGSEEENLLTRVRRLQRARPGTVTVPRAKPESQAPKIKLGNKSKAMAFAKEIESETETETEAKRQDSEAEDPSVYQTADNDSLESGSESDWMNDSPDQPIGRNTARSIFNPPRKAAGPKGAASAVRGAPLLEPKSLSQNDRNPKSRKDVGTSSEKKASRNATQFRNVSQSKQRDSSDATTTAADLADSLSKLKLQLQDFSEEESKASKTDRFTTPPSTPPKTSKPKGLMSPTKRIQIPKTPHRPSMDAFWSQDLVNEWNDHHSPRKLLLPPVTKSPKKASPKKELKENKKAFDARKHALAESFLLELDREITQGKIAELAESTGGVKLVWTKTLNTTAGRASWRRETTRTTRKADGAQLSVMYKHHASIELAEKVIDDEHRLLNVMAHEFCHLANFMVSGVTTNPHGREFKAWAAKCSRAFGDRGIEVTTKHSYDIDFKYVWECEACGAEFKRHSKSIDPQRHRCGSCKGLLKQTKPTPRGTGGGAGGASKAPSRYQTFVKEQMAVVRGENPGSPQKTVMKLIGEKWAKQEGKGTTKGSGKTGVDNVVEKMVDLTIEGEE